MAVKDIVNKKRGRPLLLGSELDKRVQAFLNTLRTRLNALSNQWAKYLLHCMGFVKHASTKANVSASNFEQLKTQFQC